MAEPGWGSARLGRQGILTDLGSSGYPDGVAVNDPSALAGEATSED
jgi:hypothetical protein